MCWPYADKVYDPDPTKKGEAVTLLRTSAASCII